MTFETLIIWVVVGAITGFVLDMVIGEESSEAGWPAETYLIVWYGANINGANKD